QSDMNADPRELEKFSALAHRWWDPESEFKPLHQINPLRLDWIARIAKLAGKSALDVGCGGGILAEAMAKRGARVKGIDLSDKALKVAQLHCLESRVAVDYEAVSAEDLAARSPAAYDVVTCMELLEHVPDPASTVRACALLARGLIGESAGGSVRPRRHIRRHGSGSRPGAEPAARRTEAGAAAHRDHARARLERRARLAESRLRPDSGERGL